MVETRPRPKSSRVDYLSLTTFRIVHPHPPVTRALRHAKSKLEAAGIKVVDWEPYKHGHGWDIIVSPVLEVISQVRSSALY